MVEFLVDGEGKQGGEGTGAFRIGEVVPAEKSDAGSGRAPTFREEDAVPRHTAMLFQKSAHERRAAAVERAGGASCSRGEVNPADAAQQAVRKGCPRVIEQGRQRASRKASAFGGGSGKRIASVRKVEAACVPPTFSTSRCFPKVSALVPPTRAYPKLNAYSLSRLVKGMMPFRLEPFPGPYAQAFANGK